jgi:hypothetical protein
MRSSDPPDRSPQEIAMYRQSILARAVALCAACLVTAVLVFVHGADLGALGAREVRVAGSAAPAVTVASSTSPLARATR